MGKTPSGRELSNQARLGAMPHSNASLFQLLSDPQLELRVERFPSAVSHELHLRPVAAPGARTEVILNKRALLTTFFRPNHLEINKLLAHSGDPWWVIVDRMPPAEIQAVYHATSVLLLLTNDHHTVLRIHLHLVLLKATDAAFLQRERHLLLNYLRSNVDRVNKSSTLWLMYKKVVAITQTQGHPLSDPGFLAEVLTTVTESGDRHFQSYYAWNFCSWLACQVRELGDRAARISALAQIYAAVSAFCHSHPTDHSAWLCLGAIVSPSLSIRDPAFPGTYQRLPALLSDPHVGLTPTEDPQCLDTEAWQEIEWIIAHALNSASGVFIKHVLAAISSSRVRQILTGHLTILNGAYPALTQAMASDAGFCLDNYNHDLLLRVKLLTMMELMRLLAWFSRVS